MEKWNEGMEHTLLENIRLPSLSSWPKVKRLMETQKILAMPGVLWAAMVGLGHQQHHHHHPQHQAIGKSSEPVNEERHEQRQRESSAINGSSGNNYHLSLISVGTIKSYIRLGTAPNQRSHSLSLGVQLRIDQRPQSWQCLPRVKPQMSLSQLPNKAKL